MLNKLPKSWGDIYADQFIDLKSIEIDSNGFFYRQMHILSILTETSLEDEYWGDIGVDELNVMLLSLSWLKKEPSTNFSKVIGELTYKNIESLSLGEFIHLDHYVVDGIHNNLFNICALLYRKTKQDGWGSIIYEPYDNLDIEARAVMFSECKIEDIYGIIGVIIDFKKLIEESYTNIFSKPIIIEDDGYVFSEEELADIEAEEKENEEKAKFSWEFTIHELTDGDITKFNSVMDLSLIFVLNQLSFRKRFIS